MIAYRAALAREWTWKILVSGFLACSGLPKPQLSIRPQLGLRLVSSSTLRPALPSSLLSAAAARAALTVTPMLSLSSAPVDGGTPSNCAEEKRGGGDTRRLHRIAVAQLRSTGDKWSNLASVAVCAGRAKKGGATMLFLPENTGFLGSGGRETLDQADPPILADPVATGNDEPVTTALREIVSEHALLPEDLDISGSSAAIPPCPVAASEILILDGLRTIANASGLWLTGTIHVGGAPPPSGSAKSQPSSTSSDTDRNEENKSEGRVYNTHVVLDDHGRLVAEYRKIHLFDVDIPGQVTIQESASTAPGQAAVVCDSPVGTCHVRSRGRLDRVEQDQRKGDCSHALPSCEPFVLAIVSYTCNTILYLLSSRRRCCYAGVRATHTPPYEGRLGLSTCYDVRFPELYAELVRRGSQVLLVPSAFTVPTGRAHWHALLRGKSVSRSD
jgi:predicted amidohydrolase